MFKSNISENKPYNLRLCTFTLHKFQEKNLNEFESWFRFKFFS